MQNKIGVMQGRLLPKFLGRYQAHPLGYWRDEFKVASELGLDCIEFILDFNDAELNPLLKDSGIEEINKITQSSGVEVFSVCADYFMEMPLHSKHIKNAELSQKILINLLNNVSKLRVSDVVIPCVDKSSLHNLNDINKFVQNLMPVIDLAEKFCINLSLETDLDPQAFFDLLRRFDSDRITVNYDIGNSAALGYNVIEELNAYGSSITDIHIKDRILGSGPVELGKGNADFTIFFNKLKEFDYKGPLIMQAFRDDEGLKIFKKQLDWIKPYLNE